MADLKQLIISASSSCIFHETGAGQLYYRCLRWVFLFSYGMILAFDITESCTFLIFLSNPEVIWPTASSQAACRLTSLPALLVPFFSLCSAFGSKNLPSLHIFRTSTNLVITLPCGMPLTQFARHFRCLLLTLRNRCILFWYLRNLRGLSKVKYVTLGWYFVKMMQTLGSKFISIPILYNWGLQCIDCIPSRS